MSSTITNCNVQKIGGSNIEIHGFWNWQGAAGSYPIQILEDPANFQHIGNLNGSMGAVVYRIKTSKGKAYDAVVAWLNPPNSDNKVFTFVDKVNSFTDGRWTELRDKLIGGTNHSNHSLEGCTSVVEIGKDGNFPNFTATISAA